MHPTFSPARYILAASLLLLALPALAQEASVSVDPEREVLVMFQPGVVTAPAGRDAGPPNAFTIASPTLRTVLGAVQVETLARVMPGFRAEDRFSTLPSGETVELTDWSRIYLLRVPTAQKRDELIEALKAMPEVAYAEPNGRVKLDDVISYAPLAEPALAAEASLLLTPNDSGFPRQWAWENDGTALQGSGTPDADVDAAAAWDITTGSSSVNIAIVESGMQANHPDFGGRVTGDAGDNTGHGTATAGIAAATGNNGQGVAGMAWAGGIINEDWGGGSHADVAAALRSASTRGGHVINNSWGLTPLGDYSATIRLAFKDVYLQNRVAVVSMGNEGRQNVDVLQFPAAFGGVLAVGATTNTDVKANYSSTGAWIDVAAPGGGGFDAGTQTEDYWYTTVPGSSYGYQLGGAGIAGTSFSAPVVTGLAALLLAVNPTLENDDIEQIIRLGVDDVNAATRPGFDNDLGTGRVNAKKALDLVRAPYAFLRRTSTGNGIDQGAGPYETMTIYGASGLSDGTYSVRAHEVRKLMAYPTHDDVNVWGRHNGALGWSRENPNVAVPFTDVVPGTVTANTAWVRTYVYEVFNTTGQSIGWFPTTPQNAVFAYTVHGRPEPPPGALSASISGPESLQPQQFGTYTATPSGGSGTLSYLWYFRVPGTSAWTNTGITTQSYTFKMTSPAGRELRCQVTRGSETVNPTKIVYYICQGYPQCTAGPAASRAEDGLPTAYALDGAAPNPFREAASVGFALPEAAEVRLVVYDLLGREVARLVEGRVEAGSHRARFEGSGLPSGVYVVRMTAGDFVGTARMTLLR